MFEILCISVCVCIKKVVTSGFDHFDFKEKKTNTKFVWTDSLRRRKYFKR